MAFSGDGRYLASAGPGDRWLRVWDMCTGRPRTHIPLAPGEVPAAVTLAEDGGTLRVLVQTGVAKPAHLREYDTFRGLETRRRRLSEGPVETAAFSSDSKQLALTNGRVIRLRDA